MLIHIIISMQDTNEPQGKRMLEAGIEPEINHFQN